MNFDTYFVRSYQPNLSREHLQRRYQQQHTVSPPTRYTTTIDQTTALMEQIKSRPQPKSTAFVSYPFSKTTRQTSSNTTLISLPSTFKKLDRIEEPLKRTLKPHELCYQLNLKLEYLILNRLIDRSRVIVSRTSSVLSNRVSPTLLQSANTTSRTVIKNGTKQNDLLTTALLFSNNSGHLSIDSQSTLIMNNDEMEKDSWIDEGMEEMVEEQNIIISKAIDGENEEKVEDEEDEGENEEESVKSSESDGDTDTYNALDPHVLVSDKVRRVGNMDVRTGLIPSIFINIPPTIRFGTENQRIDPLPAPLKKMMKWKMSTITPNIVKNTVTRSGFRLINADEGNDWLGTWSRHMKPPCFRAIREFQKVNHFPGSFQIGRKDRLWRNLSHMQAIHSKREFDFVPQTFVLPADLLLLKRIFDETTDSRECKWIIKPPASARGQGIRVISKLDHVPKKRPVVVQKYIANPYLINGHKFDLRLYVYVTSHDPLRIYLYEDGLARFASRKYSPSMKSLGDRFMHLTNYSINRYNSEYKSNNDHGACAGHKWSLKALWTYLKKRDIDVVDVWERIKDLIIKTIISADAYVNVLVKANVKRKFSVHELFGFDVILDEQCKPWIVEVNISPSLHSNSPLDVSVKGSMIADLLNLSGFQIPDRRDVLSDTSVRKKARLPKSLIFDKRILAQTLSTDEKLKHQYFIQRYNDEQARKSILDMFTPDDIRLLTETEDEYARRGSFERIYPTHQTRKYLKYFETPRYYNLLLNEWITKYYRLEERGISLLNSFCKKLIHIQNPAEISAHLWAHNQKQWQTSNSHRDTDNGD
ncbi:unnamed protein product [Didymodactylos carnosus]|uniref:Tubulin polyglutamylase TTLL4 n=1 Tax=Didymodactylos carnosus TaxID=1234261 RepID=A0A8S2I9L7_9BILA|nr:unnamed protein product [Didymodactylos carnosus]CAF3712400.1 unnamed protein product [Didymodactylos carnosus]